MTPLLSVHGLSVSYGGVQALADVNLEVRPEQIVGLIGPNGAGKTSLIDAVTGFARASGEVMLDGRQVQGLRPHERARLGLARTWQAGDLFDDLTVAEHLTLSGSQPSVWKAIVELVRLGSRRREPADDQLGRLGIADLAASQPDELSTGQRKLVGVARALALNPRVVCLDEPAAGLDSAESKSLGRRLREIATSGVGMLLVDHDMDLVLAYCDYVVVLEFGRVIAQGAPQEIRSNPRVIDAYLGTSGESGQTSALAPLDFGSPHE